MTHAQGLWRVACKHDPGELVNSLLDEPIPVLDNKTPRQCARSKKGRDKVIEWLKHLENHELRRTAGQGQAPYNSSWMWEELKLTRYRD